MLLQPHEPTTFGALIFHNWIVTPGTTLIRRDVLRLVGEFDTTTDPCDDADLTIRTSRHGGIGFVDRTLLRWRRHPDTLSQTSPRWRKAALRVRAKALVDLSNTPAQLGVARMGYLTPRRSSAGRSGIRSESAILERRSRISARPTSTKRTRWPTSVGGGGARRHSSLVSSVIAQRQNPGQIIRRSVDFHLP